MNKLKLPNSLKSTLIVIVVLCFQYAIYLLLFRPYIIKWGATDREATMPMMGDKYAGVISSTRAIDINKPSTDVWPYLVDLGADRKGFYSLVFLENMLGLEIAEYDSVEEHELNVGRLVPYTSPDSYGNYNEGFRVIEVVQGQSFVLQDWGEFLIKDTDKNNSRLIIRTHYKSPDNAIDKLWNSIFDLLHFIMEKRMMLGIKDGAESNGENYTTVSDLIWFMGVFISGLAALLLVYICHGHYKFLLPTIFFTVWQFALSVLNYKPVYGIALVIFVGTCYYIYRSFLKITSSS